MEIKTLKSMYDAIKTMIVRGAPAIGIAGAHGCALFALELLSKYAPTEDLWQNITHVTTENLDEIKEIHF